MSSVTRALPQKQVIWATPRRHPRVSRKPAASRQPAFSSAPTKVAGVPDLDELFDVPTTELEPRTTLMLRREARRQADSALTPVTVETARRRSPRSSPPPIPPVRRQLALPARDTSVEPRPALPGLTDARAGRSLPGLAEARQQRPARADTLGTLDELPAGPRPTALVPRERETSRSRSALAGVGAALLVCTVLGAGWIAAAALAYAMTIELANAIALLVMGSFGVVAALSAAAVVRWLHCRPSALAPITVGTVGGLGFGLGWLLRLVVPGGLENVELAYLGDVPAQALAALDANLALSPELMTPALAGAWVAELMLTLLAITVAVRWVDRD